MTGRLEPRNARAIASLKPGEPVIVSFIGDTPMEGPHVYADGGKRYDWSCLKDRPVEIIVRAGVDCAAAVREIFDQAQLYPTIIDFERQVVGSVVDRNGRVWPRRKRSEPWLALFG